MTIQGKKSQCSKGGSAPPESAVESETLALPWKCQLPFELLVSK